MPQHEHLRARLNERERRGHPQCTPPLALTSLAFQASSPTRQIMGELSMASPPRAASLIRSITE